MRPIMPQDQYADISFPLGGVDLSLGFGGQRPGTTRMGVNVRANEPLAQSARGGCRPGLDRYINGQAGGSNLIQHLNYVVDPQAEAMPWYDPPYPNPADLDGPGIAGGPNYFAADGQLFYTDPNGNVIRNGGTGVRYRKKRKKSPIRFVQSKQSSGGGGSGGSTWSDTFDANVTTGHLIVVAIVYQAVNGGPGQDMATYTVSDSLGNTYSQIGSFVSLTSTSVGSGANEHGFGVGLFYCVSAFTGACTVSAATGDNVFTGLALLEYKNNKLTGVLDATASNSFVATSTGDVTVSTGSISVTAAGDLVVGMVAAYNPLDSTPVNNGTGFTDRVSNGVVNTIAPIQDGLFNSSTPSTWDWNPMDALTGPTRKDAYVAIGASFKQA